MRQLHAKKSNFFLFEAKNFGRVLSDGKIRYDPRNLQALLEMKRPKQADELQKLMCAANWMRTSITSYAELIGPLQKAMDAACVGVEK